MDCVKVVESEFQKKNIKTLSGDGELMLTIPLFFAKWTIYANELVTEFSMILKSLEFP